MKLTQLPIWSRILAAKPRSNARSPIGILRAVLANNHIYRLAALAGPVRKTADYRNYFSALELTDLYCDGVANLPRRADAYRPLDGGRWDRKRFRAEKFTLAMRDARREANDPKFAKAQQKLRAAQTRMQAVVMHIAHRYHHTVRSLYTSKYAGIAWSPSAKKNVEWDRYAKSYKFPCKYSDAGAFFPAMRYDSTPATRNAIKLSPTRGNSIWLPEIPAAMLKSASLSEPHPIGLFAVPVNGQPGIFACMTAIDGDRKWTVAGFCLRGRLVPECVARGTTTLADISSQENAETRQVMIDRYGIEKYLSEAGATELDHSDVGTLYDLSGMKVVKVVNSTPEPDGSYRDYFLRVPPEMESAQAAVAWTFGLNPEEYAPVAQS